MTNICVIRVFHGQCIPLLPGARCLTFYIESGLDRKPIPPWWSHTCAIFTQYCMVPWSIWATIPHQFFCKHNKINQNIRVHIFKNWRFPIHHLRRNPNKSIWLDQVVQPHECVSSPLLLYKYPNKYHSILPVICVRWVCVNCHVRHRHWPEYPIECDTSGSTVVRVLIYLHCPGNQLNRRYNFDTVPFFTIRTSPSLELWAWDTISCHRCKRRDFKISAFPSNCMRWETTLKLQSSAKRKEWQTTAMGFLQFVSWGTLSKKLCTISESIQLPSAIKIAVRKST